MGTNSTIAIERKDGTRTAISCHYDGYIEGVGVTLQLAYNTAEKVEELLKLGDLSSLHYHTEPTDGKHNFEEPQKGVCIAYHRDRGEEFYQSDYKNEFNYTFNERDCVWYVEKRISNYKNETPAMKELLLDCPERYKTNLLLDEIAECDFSDWGADEYAATGDEVIQKCLEKAKEARKEIIKEKIEYYNSYYAAYCD